MSETLYADRLAIVPSTYCTLNCKLCFEFPNIVGRRETCSEDVCRDIDACFELFDHVGWLQFVGGEVFIYRDFAKLLKYAQKYRDRFDRLIIESNATVFPNADEWASMLSYGKDLKVFISDYGVLSAAIVSFIAFLEGQQIEYEIRKYHGEDQYYGGWIDITDVRDYHEPDDVLLVNFRNCSQTRIKNMHCYGGKLFACSGSCFIDEMKLYPPRAWDFVDLHDKSRSKEEKRDIIREFYMIPRRSCRYCLQKYIGVLPRYPAAEQT